MPLDDQSATGNGHGDVPPVGLEHTRPRGSRFSRRAAILQRRRDVARLYLTGHLTQHDIAQRIGVSRQIVAKDLAALYDEWRAHALLAVDEIKTRELAELDAMERELVLRLNRVPVDTVPPLNQLISTNQLRLRIKERRAKILGLDAPLKLSPTTPSGDAPAAFTFNINGHAEDPLAAQPPPAPRERESVP